MSKIALCFSGQRRMFKSAYPNIKQFILDKFNCDVFIHTFLKSDKLEYGIVNSFRYEDEGTLEEYLNLYNPKEIKIEYYNQEKEDDLIYLGKQYKTNFDDGRIKRFLAMLDGINKANKLRGPDLGRYDYVVRIRPDIHLTDFQLPKGNLMIDHYGNGLYNNAPGDVLAIGKESEMSIYCNLWEKMHDYYFEDGLIPDCQTSLEHHLRKNNLSWEISNFVDIMIRPEIWFNNEYSNKR